MLRNLRKSVWNFFLRVSENFFTISFLVFIGILLICLVLDIVSKDYAMTTITAVTILLDCLGLHSSIKRKKRRKGRN